MRTPATSLPLRPSRRLRVGACVLTIDCREVDRGDGSAPQRITLKAMEVLLVLAAQPGRVIAREALLESVWAGTMPGDDVVTQAITTLRKALGDDRDAPAYLETIPKSGYRLLAEVEWLADPAAVPPAMGRDAAQAPSPRAARPRAAWRMIAAAGLIALALVPQFWWATSGARSGERATLPASTSKPGGEHPYTLQTSRPGPQNQPALSPDGVMVAYAMPPDGVVEAPALFLQSTQDSRPRQLTAPPYGHSDHQPRWSPDGRQLMFARIDDKARCDLLLVPASGGATRTVGRCDRIQGRYDWLPDGSGIIAGLDAEADSTALPLAIMRLDTGTWHPLAYAHATGDVESHLRFTPDARPGAFHRGSGRSDAWVMPATGVRAHRRTRVHDNTSGWAWTPDSRSFLLGVPGAAVQTLRYDMASGETRALDVF